MPKKRLRAYSNSEGLVQTARKCSLSWVHCPLTESLDTTEFMIGEDRILLCACAG